MPTAPTEGKSTSVDIERPQTATNANTNGTTPTLDEPQKAATTMLGQEAGDSTPVPSASTEQTQAQTQTQTQAQTETQTQT